MDRRSFLSLCGLSGATATAGCLGASHPLPPVEAEIRGRRLLVSDGESYRPILRTSAKRIRTGDPHLEGMFAADGSPNAAVPTRIHERLARDYADVQYQIRLLQRTETPLNGVDAGDLADYNADRRNFNRVLVGDRVRFQLGVTNRPSIQSFGSIRRTGEVLAKGATDTDDEAKNADDETKDSDDEASHSLRLSHGALRTEFRRRTYRTTAEVARTCRVGRRYDFEIGGDFGRRVTGVRKRLS